MRYAATTLRGCLLELLDWLRTTNSEAADREAAVIDNDENAPTSASAEPWQALEDYLTGRRVAVITGPGLELVSIDDPALQAQLDREVPVRALLDSDAGRAALLPAGASAGRRAHLDVAAVRLATDLGRDLTRAASLALRDRPERPDGILTAAAMMTPRTAGPSTTTPPSTSAAHGRSPRETQTTAQPCRTSPPCGD